MGVSSLISHAAGKKHQKGLESNKVTIKTFMQPRQKSSNSEDSSESPISIPPRAASTSLNEYVKDANTTKAGVLWTLKTVMSKSSLRSCEQLKHLFVAMFPNRTIAKSFTLRKTKCGYYVTYGIAPYFGELIKTLINKSPCFSVFFDESLNSLLHVEQMDMNVRYWDNDNSLVKLNYVTSRFFERSNPEDILSKLLAGLKPICEAKIIHLSMDGPNTNWKVLDSLQKYREKFEYSYLSNHGSCGLHMAYGAIKTGAQESGWDIHKILKAM